MRAKLKCSGKFSTSSRVCARLNSEKLDSFQTDAGQGLKAEKGAASLKHRSDLVGYQQLSGERLRPLLLLMIVCHPC